MACHLLECLSGPFLSQHPLVQTTPLDSWSHLLTGPPASLLSHRSHTQFVLCASRGVRTIHMISLSVINLITCFRWCLPDFSTVRFSPFQTLSYWIPVAKSSRPTLKGGGIMSTSCKGEYGPILFKASYSLCFPT